MIMTDSQATVDLREKDRAAIIAIAEKTLGPDVEVWAYGSRVKGTAHEGSDLNLVVKGRSDDLQLRDQSARFRDALQASNIPILVQVFEWSALPERFREGIEAEHVVLV